MISTQHAEPSKATRTKERAGHSGPKMTAPSMEEMNKLINEKAVKATPAETKSKNSTPPSLPSLPLSLSLSLS
eukprot:4085300-Prorocentrum_lima.AAC.1